MILWRSARNSVCSSTCRGFDAASLPFDFEATTPSAMRRHVRRWTSPRFALRAQRVSAIACKGASHGLSGLHAIRVCLTAAVVAAPVSDSHNNHGSATTTALAPPAAPTISARPAAAGTRTGGRPAQASVFQSRQRTTPRVAPRARKSSANGWKASTAPDSTTRVTISTGSRASRVERYGHAVKTTELPGAGPGRARRQRPSDRPVHRSRRRSICGWRLRTSARPPVP